MSSDQEALGADAQFFQHLREGRFMIQRSEGTGQFVFYPRMICPKTGKKDLSFEEVSGRGVIYGTTAVQRPEKYGGNYNLCLIDLEEGVRMLSRVVDVDPDQIQIGMKVQAHIESVDFGTFKNSDQPVVVFRLVEAA
ncbi:Zn-ribbon domain-containing OB-fold protein [Endozoicomonas arenosclerae]|uniref:Zn-ribbon domain-containing OB-fold protein n=1 Tax=Endozoicomonas arenosclerae TaxID=1633495 RepID=UPI000781B6B2|nr:OB-fold domain-containing protein [Endozoicomonas arenosclerae]